MEDTKDGIVFSLGYEDDIYNANMKYTKEGSNGVYRVNTQKKKRQRAKFEENYKVPIEECDKLIGKTVLGEVKAMGKHTYIDLKKFS